MVTHFLGQYPWFGAIECAIWWGMGTPRGWRELSNVQCDEVIALRVVWWRLVGAAPVCPPVSPCRGASIVQFPAYNACIFGWKRRYADVRAGTQAPPLRILLGWIAHGRLVLFGRITRGRLISFGWITCRRLALFLRYSARMPLRILFFYAFYFCSIYFFNG